MFFLSLHRRHLGLSSQAMGTELSRHLAAVMFTDMEGYTALMQRDEAAALQSRERHRKALQRSVPTHDGNLLQYFGDGSLSIFRSSVQAVEAAVAIQRDLQGKPALRIGLHVGDIAYDEQGAYGDAINLAARLEALSVPGGILISEKIFDDIRRHPKLTTVPGGSVRLKNIGEVVLTFALSVEGVAVPTDPISSGTEQTSQIPAELRERLDDRARQPAYATAPTGTVPGRVPLVGRSTEVATLRHLLERTENRSGNTAFIRGPRGVGKSRLAHEAAEYAKSRGWTVLSGRAYPAEQFVPLAPFSDAFLPILQGLSDETLGELAPGGEDALRALFPVLGAQPRAMPERHGEPGELQARLFWHFMGMLGRLAAYRPVLLIIEDLDFADRSSLELFHFVARRCTDKPIFLIGEYTGMNPKRKRELVEIEQSLVGMNAATVFDIETLTEEETGEFLRRALNIEDQDISDLTSLVYHWTRGNPFFLKGTLRGLVEAGVLRRDGGIWHGLELASIELPHSVRDAVLVWMGHLSERALNLAELLSVLGTQVSYDVLTHLSERDEAEVAGALDELLRHQILVESEDRWRLIYDFRHPLIRETLRSELPLGRRRQLHATVAESLEGHYGDRADEHADELAYHFGQAKPGQSAAKAAHYLFSAGQNALSRHANREAVAYLQEALDRIEATPPGKALEQGESLAPLSDVIRGLARARRRLGNISASVALWRRILGVAQAEQDEGQIARTHQEIGLTYMAGGSLEEAIEEFEQALEWAGFADDQPLMVRIQLAQGLCYHATGRGDAAQRVVEDALEIAQRLKHPALLGRVHSALLRLHIWTGQVEKVRSHAEMALDLSRKREDRGVEFWIQWAMGAMEGLIGNTAQMSERIEEARRLADEIGSPLLQLETVELTVELAYARGDWDEGIVIGSEAIELARSLGQTTILPRLLVWVSLMHLGRSHIETGDKLTREAWEVSRADGALEEAGYLDVHTVVPAHIGRAAYHMALHEWDDAIRIAEAGLAIADRTGYVFWAIHHILPIIAEASIHSRDLVRAQEIARRMRKDAEAVGHPLGLAWADAVDALVTWLQGDPEVGAVSLRKGAESLETIPLTYEAACMRRQLAGRLAEVGDREGALEELRHVHEVFTRLGARHELEATIGMFRQIDAEPPDREIARPNP